MKSSKRSKRQKKDQVYPKESVLNIGDKPVQKVVIVKSGEIPVEEDGFHVEL